MDACFLDKTDVVYRLQFKNGIKTDKIQYFTKKKEKKNRNIGQMKYTSCTVIIDIVCCSVTFDLQHVYTCVCSHDTQAGGM